ncbi:MAG TPA: nodulation protein NfeD [Dehalococcoidia bacterium]|nr:nodulation protein NfeD [Dehalococcoidia bacterium]
MRRIPTVTALAALAAVSLAFSACGRSFEPGAVHLLTVDGTVDPVLERYIDRGLDDAAEDDARAVVIMLDTPGGLLESTRAIVKRINASGVPVIVWVAPSGARAGSAGTFITMAGHVAAMAPGTNIGAAHPVGAGGEDIEDTLGEKITNDAAAFIRSLAEQRGRNADWAERAVRESASISAEEAAELHVVDFVATDMEDLLRQANGRTVTLESGQATLDVEGARVVKNDMTYWERFLSLIASPDLAFLFLSLGGILLLIGLLQPGTFVPETLGFLMLVLGFFAVSVLPYNWVGIILLVTAAALFAGEAFTPGFGFLGLTGIVCLILGGLFLTDTTNPDFQVSRWLVYGFGIVAGGFLLLLINAIIRTRRMPAYVGGQAMVGSVAVARSDLDPQGIVFLKGERWRAVAEDGPIREGERVTITDVRGLTLTVRRAEPADERQEGAHDDQGA